MSKSKNLFLDTPYGKLGPTPENEVQAGELTERLRSGEFHVATDVQIPVQCIDGRGGAKRKMPNAAGGSETMFVMDDLTTKRFSGDETSTVNGYVRTLEFLRDQGFPIGGHDDEHAEGMSSGCGANDKLKDIYGIIAADGEKLAATIRSLGHEISSANLTTIMTNAAARLEFSAGSSLLAAQKEIAGASSVDHLQGDHHEVAVGINMKPGTTLDRDKLHAAYPDMDAFNFDAWALIEAARATSSNDEEARIKVDAGMIYTTAAAYALCGDKMPVIAID